MLRRRRRRFKTSIASIESRKRSAPNYRSSSGDFEQAGRDERKDAAAAPDPGEFSYPSNQNTAAKFTSAVPAGPRVFIRSLIVAPIAASQA